MKGGLRFSTAVFAEERSSFEQRLYPGTIVIHDDYDLLSVA
jgi:hypothetical protein